MNILFVSGGHNIKTGHKKRLTHDHESELKASFHRLSVNLVGKICKANITLQVLLLL